MINASYDKEFVFHDGRRADNLKNLRNVIETMPDYDFITFVNTSKNDFANWIEYVLMDADLAQELRKTIVKRETLKILNERLDKVQQTGLDASRHDLVEQKPNTLLAAASHAQDKTQLNDAAKGKNQDPLSSQPAKEKHKISFFGIHPRRHAENASQQDNKQKTPETGHPDGNIHLENTAHPSGSALYQIHHDAARPAGSEHRPESEHHPAPEHHGHSEHHIFFAHSASHEATTQKESSQKESSHEQQSHHASEPIGTRKSTKSENITWIIVYALIVIAIIALVLYKFVF